VVSHALVLAHVRATLLAAVALTSLVVAATSRYSDTAAAAHAESYVKLAKYSPDGDAIVGPGLLTSRIKVWDSHTGALRYVLEGHVQGANTVRFRPDGNRIVSGAYDGTAKIWDARTGALIRTLDCRPAWPIDARYSPGGDRVLTYGSYYDPDLGVYVTNATMWNAETGAPLFTIRGFGPDGVRDAAFSPDGARLLTVALVNREAKLWDARTGAPLHELGGHGGTIFGILWSPDGRRVMTMGMDLASKMWDAATGRLLYTFSVRGTATGFAEFSPDSRRVLTSDFDQTARIWDVDSGALVHALAGHSAPVRWSRFNADASLVVTPSFDDTARVWDAKTGKLRFVLRGHAGSLTSAQFDPTGQRIITASHDETAKVWSAKTGALLYSIGLPNTDDFEEKLGGFEFRADGAQLIIPMISRDIRVFDPATGTRLFTLEPDAGADPNVR
jgi:WD40 repeat protein